MPKLVKARTKTNHHPNTGSETQSAPRLEKKPYARPKSTNVKSKTENKPDLKTKAEGGGKGSYDRALMVKEVAKVRHGRSSVLIPDHCSRL